MFTLWSSLQLCNNLKTYLNFENNNLLRRSFIHFSASQIPSRGGEICVNVMAKILLRFFVSLKNQKQQNLEQTAHPKKLSLFLKPNWLFTKIDDQKCSFFASNIVAVPSIKQNLSCNTCVTFRQLAKRDIFSIKKADKTIGSKPFASYTYAKAI